MKIFINGCAIIEISDIRYLGKLPEYAASELKHYYEPGEMFEVFKNEKSVEFFRKEDAIIDYNYISNLSVEEIEKECLCLKNELERRAQIYYESSTAMRAKYDRNREYNIKNKNMIYKLSKMEEYLRHKNEYDEAFNIFKEEVVTDNQECTNKLIFENKEQE